MRILVNHSQEDRIYRQNLTFLMKEAGLSGIATDKTYDITTLQKTAETIGAEAILLSNPDTLKNCLGDKATLDKFRGTRINYKIPVIVINPIEHIHTVNHGKWLLKRDLAKFKRIKEPVQEFSFTVVDTQESQKEAYAFLAGCLVISYDIETNEKLQITCVSFTGVHRDGRVETFLLPLDDFGQVHYRTEDELAEALLWLRKVHALPVPKAAFNGIYDAQYCITYQAWPEQYLLDVMILGWAEFSELPRALDFAASIHCYDYFAWKDESDKAKAQKDIRGYWGYCAKDSWYTLRVLLSLLSDLKEYQIYNYRATFKHTFPDLYCAFEGCLVDVVKRDKLKAETEAQQAQKLKDLRTMSASPTFNPGSPAQVSQFIYEVIGAKKSDRAKSKYATDNKTLQFVAIQHPLLARIVDLVVAYRKDVKAISTYYEAELLNDRLYWNLDPSGTETGRKASKSSNFWVGAQIQNIPPYLKPCLIADPGFILLERDNNKSEARCVGYLSQCLKLIEALEDLERDFYKVCASNFFSVPYENVTKALRNDVTKRIIHGTNYMMGPETFVDTAGPKRIFDAMIIVGTKIKNTLDFVKYLLSLYHRAYPEVKTEWYPKIKEEIKTTGKLVSPTGWTRVFFGDINKHNTVFRSGVAHAPQSLSVEIVNRDYYKMYRELVLPSQGAFRLKAQIHDSMFAQARETEAMLWAKRMHECCGDPIIVHGRKMILPVDTKMGKSWGDVDEKNNPTGMKEVHFA